MLVTNYLVVDAFSVTDSLNVCFAHCHFACFEEHVNVDESARKPSCEEQVDRSKFWTYLRTFIYIGFSLNPALSL